MEKNAEVTAKVEELINDSVDFVCSTEELIHKLQDLIVEAKKVGPVLKTKGDVDVIAEVEDFLRDDEEKVCCDNINYDWSEICESTYEEMSSKAEEVLKMHKVKAETIC